MDKTRHKKHFYGTTVLGKKGQVVIPAEARQTMKLADGEKLMVFGMGSEMVVLMKLANIEQLAKHLSDQLERLQTVIKQVTK